MTDFAGKEDLLRDFLTEAAELLADVDRRLLELESSPADGTELNAIFRGFHTIKGGAGFLGATELVRLCHLTESVFDLLRSGRMPLSPGLLDTVFAATAEVQRMFRELGCSAQPGAADGALLVALEAAIAGGPRAAAAVPAVPEPAAHRPEPSSPDWAALFASISGASAAAASPHPRHGRRASDAPGADGLRSGRRETDKIVIAKDTTIRIDTARLDQVLDLTGEIGLAKNRLSCLRAALLSGRLEPETLRALDESIGHLDLLVGDLQSAVMKTRMQPAGRLFQRYPRLVRDLARELGKSVALEIEGEDTELDRGMIEELSDPLLHLIRNALDHGLETAAERTAQGKPEQGTIVLRARQSGDRIVITAADDGRGMRPDALRARAIEQKLLEPAAAHALDDRSALQLVFLPGFSTRDQISSISGRGVGMDVVKTNVQRLNGRIEIASTAGAGTSIAIHVPLTMAVLPVLVVRAAEQSFALPLSIVREIVRIDSGQIRSVSGKAALSVRGEALPVHALASLLGLARRQPPSHGAVLHTGERTVVLAVDGFGGRDDVVMKPLEGFKPKGIAGASLSGDGSVLLVLDADELLLDSRPEPSSVLFPGANRAAA